MQEKRKLKLKKFYFHPITMFILATVLILVISFILSLLQVQATYNIVNTATNELEPKLVTIENLLTFNSLKSLISKSMINFASLAPLSMLIISLIGISIAEATGLIETLSKRKIKKLSKKQLTFLILFLGVISSLINDVGYAILIPLAAIIYEINGRNPLLGIITAFCGTAFGSGVSIFVGWTEVNLIPATTSAAYLIDTTAHISLTSNLIFIIVASILIPIIGTIIIEKMIGPKLPKYHFHDRTTGVTLKTSELLLSDIEEAEQNKIAREKNEKRGLKYALIASIIMILLFIYMLLPSLPGSGLLLDITEKTYVNQLFGSNSYFHSAFPILMTIFFIIIALAYGIGAKSIKNDRDLIEKAGNKMKDMGMLLILIFVFSQFLAVWKESNIGIIITSWLATLLSHLEFTDIPLIVVTLIIIAIANLFCPSISTKWKIFSPVVVPLLMQGNISPQFAMLIMRVSDSMTKGITPFLSFFILYIGYLNLYNQNKQKPITIHQSLKIISPYFLLISLTWILLVVSWYIIGLPIGPGVTPTI